MSTLYIKNMVCYRCILLEALKAKPKKTSGFRARLDQAMKEQQRMQEEKAKQANKKK